MLQRILTYYSRSSRKRPAQVSEKVVSTRAGHLQELLAKGVCSFLFREKKRVFRNALAITGNCLNQNILTKEIRFLDWLLTRA